MINFNQIKKKELIIRGKKTYLKILDNSNISERYITWLNDPEVNRYSSRSGKSFNKEDVYAYVDECNKSDKKLLLAIFEDNNNLHIGNVLLIVNYYKKEINISNLIGEKDYWGKGYIIDVDSHAIHFGFAYLKALKFTMGNFSKNRASTFKSSSLGAEIKEVIKNNKSLKETYNEVIKFELISKNFYAKFPYLKNQINWKLKNAY